jgi:hypothetical protein
MSEANSVAVDRCLCGASQCLGRSVGFWELPIEQQERLYTLGVTGFLQAWFEEMYLAVAV